MISRGLIAVSCLLVLAGSVAGNASGVARQPQSTLKAFNSDTDILAFIKRNAPKPRPAGQMALDAAGGPPPPPPAPAAAAATTQSVTVTAAREPGITNNQEAGVDEGDIVKKRGDILVVLRRGRLFTISLANGGMKPVDVINAYPPGVNARDDWYDEMLLRGDRIIVIGYSYGRGGTEINRFHLDSAGHLAFEDAYQLRSNDYYSSRNYASRLIGSHLIFYSPLYMDFYGDPLARLPALRHWTGDHDGKFARIASARHIYAVQAPVENGPIDIAALHTVTTCDVAARQLDCTATSVFGPASRSFYVSGNAVYVWASGYAWQHHAVTGLLYRLPLNGDAPSAIRVHGAPTDQFSFREDPGVLNVLVRADSAGDAMWSGEHSAGDIALLRAAAAVVWRRFGRRAIAGLSQPAAPSGE